MGGTVGIIGSGIMGAGLVEVTSRAGYDTIIRSRTVEGAEGVIEKVRKSLDRQISKERITTDDRDEALGRITATHDLAELKDCDLVIESVVEDLGVKKELFAELDGIVQPGAILATNTSTLPVVEMAMATMRPDKVCGIHFFNPAPVMKLVEIVRPLTASDETIEYSKQFSLQCGKDPIVVEDRAGFVVNALLFPYLNNAIRMWENGTASMEHIDTAMKEGCNFPMGPFALLDLVGLDTSLKIMNALYDEFLDPNYSPATTLRRKVTAGHLGRKTGRGFYDYS